MTTTTATRPSTETERAEQAGAAATAAAVAATPARWSGTRARARRRATVRRAVAWTVVVALVAGWWMFLRPASLGGPVTFITVAGVSMEPGMHTDDVAVMYERDSYSHGDIVAFRASATPGQDGQGAYVIHRIVGGNADDGFVMRGDNNDWDDPWTPTGDEITGKKLLLVPGLGTVTRWLAQPVNLAALVSAMMVALVITDPKPSRARPGRDEEPSQDPTDEPDEPDGEPATAGAEIR